MWVGLSLYVTSLQGLEWVLRVGEILVTYLQVWVWVAPVGDVPSGVGVGCACG